MTGPIGNSILAPWLLLCLLLSCPPLPAQETGSIKATETYRRLKSGIDRIRVVDVHEHISQEKDWLKQVPDFFDLVMRDYTGADIRNLGNTIRIDWGFRNKSLDMDKRWALFLPVWNRTKNTGYMRCLRLGFKKVHGIEVKDADSIKRINASIVKLYKPGYYRRILSELGGIDYVITPKSPHFRNRGGYPDFFRFARYIDGLLVFHSPQDIENLERRFGRSIHSLEDLEKVYRRFVADSIKEGIVGFKTALAYTRPIDFTRHSREKAEAQLRNVLVHTSSPWGLRKTQTTLEGQELTNFCMHTMLRLIEESGLPLSVHTGLQTGGRKDIRFTNPQHLIPLFKEYKNINFDLYHGGFPFVHAFGELGKSWPNVHLDLCWFHTISPAGARAQLSELLELVPINKILAFGADTSFVESALGHLEMAKDNCAIVMAQKVLNGFFTEAEALEYATRIFRTNAVELFKLEKKEAPVKSR